MVKAALDELDAGDAEAALHRRDHRRRDAPRRSRRSGLLDRARRRRARGLLRTRRGRDGRREPAARSRSSASTPASTPRGTSSTTRRSRARRPSRTSASGPTRSARPTSSARRASSPATSSACWRSSTSSASPQEGATFLLNAPHGPEEVWDHLPAVVQEQIIDKRLRLHVVDATSVAREAGLGRRVNTVLQTCFFALAGVLPLDEAIEAIKAATRRRTGSAERWSSRATSRRSTGRSRACTRSRSRAP